MSSRMVRVLTAGLLIGLLMWSSFALLVGLGTYAPEGSSSLFSRPDRLFREAFQEPLSAILCSAAALLTALLAWAWARSRNGRIGLGVSAAIAGVAAVVGFVLGGGPYIAIAIWFALAPQGPAAVPTVVAAGLLSVGASALFLVAVGALRECQGQGS